MKILKGLLSLLLCLCLITPMGSAIVALNDGGIANMGSQANSGSPTSVPSETPAPSDTDTPVEAPDYAALYNDLMAAATFAEAHALLEGLTDEQLSAFIDSLTEEQYAALEEHINELIAAAEEDGDLEYVYTTVNFTNVAPLLDPVCGSPTRGASVSDDEAGSGNGDSGMVRTKNAVANGDGTYTITLEAYATGSQIITEVTEDIPTDIVLVLDQSGSMAELFPIKVSAADPTLGMERGYYKYIERGSTYDVQYRNGDWQYYYDKLFAWGWRSLSINDTIYLTRLDALKNTVTSFANAVSEKAKGKDGTLGTDDDVNHRIAVVGFASQSGYGSNNTELLSISGTNSGSVGVRYSRIKNQDLKDVLQSMAIGDGQNMVKAAIDALAAEGATRVDLGMDMANRILNANPVQPGQERNRVVIVFTDGSPTDSNGFELIVANNAISTSRQIKNAGATVYSVGIFSGANANSPGVKPSDDLNQDSPQMNNACNWFMQNLSSNNGNVQSPSYYLSAGDADALNDIFEKISQQIEGGSSTTLSSETVIKDIIAPAFTPPEGASITLETWKYNGPDNGPDSAWTKNADAMGARATVDGDQVSVTGFDFAENYVGTVTDNDTVTYHGNKLVISFTVSPKAGFLGGNNVYTNANAGVYENSSAINPVLTFERPQVNVPIGDVSVTASDKNVYLLNDLTAAQLKKDATVTVGGVSLNLAAADNNYGLEPWQTEYVDISVVIKDARGNAVTVGIDELSDDTTYSITVTVSPKPDTGYDKDGNPLPGTLATPKSNIGRGNIYVFKPVLTFADSEVWYGGQYTDYTANYKPVAWKHGTDEANTETMGNAPELTLDYATTPEDAIKKGYIVVPDDIPVNVLVKIGETAIDHHVTFGHANCSHENCGFNPETCEFILHVKTCSLTVEKAIAEGSQLQDSDQSFIFKVSYPGIKVGEVTILPSAEYNVLIVGAGSRTIVGLPVGSYTVRENTDWSWRYELVEGQNGVLATLPAESPEEAIVTMTNRLNNEFWLSDEATAKNVFNSNGTEYTPIPAIIPGKEDLTDEAD